MSLALNRNSKIGGIAQTAFRKIGGFTKCCKFDGVNDVAYTGQKTNAQLATAFGSASNYTFYAKVKYVDNGGSQALYGIHRPLVGSASRFYYQIIRVNADTFKLSYVAVSGATRQSNTSWRFDSLTNGIMEIVIRVSADNGEDCCAFYMNGDYSAASETASSIDRLVGLSSFTDYRIVVGGRFNSDSPSFTVKCSSYILDMAMMSGSYDGSTAFANIANSASRYKFNDALGATLTNYGSSGSAHNLTIANADLVLFHTLVKE